MMQRYIKVPGKFAWVDDLNSSVYDTMYNSSNKINWL